MKKLYSSPLTELENVKMSGVILTSPVEDSHPVPPLGPGAPKRRTPVF